MSKNMQRRRGTLAEYPPKNRKSKRLYDRGRLMLFYSQQKRKKKKFAKAPRKGQRRGRDELAGIAGGSPPLPATVRPCRRRQYFFPFLRLWEKTKAAKKLFKKIVLIPIFSKNCRRYEGNFLPLLFQQIVMACFARFGSSARYCRTER